MSVKRITVPHGTGLRIQAMVEAARNAPKPVMILTRTATFRVAEALESAGLTKPDVVLPERFVAVFADEETVNRLCDGFKSVVTDLSFIPVSSDSVDLVYVEELPPRPFDLPEDGDLLRMTSPSDFVN